ncbi:MAG: hypothetical protein J6X70_11000 [Muribaculaceae bacterium]|nr:hypothetical protein [Muribaculaceae bacterium]
MANKIYITILLMVTSLYVSGKGVDFDGNLPDSILIEECLYVYTPINITRETFDMHKIGCALIKETDSIRTIVETIQELTYIGEMPYDSKSLSKRLLLLRKGKLANDVVWFDNDNDDIIGRMILFYKNDDYDVIWISLGYTYSGWSKYETSHQLMHWLKCAYLLRAKE